MNRRHATAQKEVRHSSRSDLRHAAGHIHRRAGNADCRLPTVFARDADEVMRLYALVRL